MYMYCIYSVKREYFLLEEGGWMESAKVNFLPSILTVYCAIHVYVVSTVLLNYIMKIYMYMYVYLRGTYTCT